MIDWLDDHFGWTMLVGGIMLITGCVWGSVIVERTSCVNRWKDSGFEYRYGMWSDCQIKTKKGWIPARAYRSNQDAD